MCGNESEKNQERCDDKCIYKGDEICPKCYISTENSSHTRRCFMTGEYCSQKTNIHHERKKLYREVDGGVTISAFVIMNFSDMADVVYKWRIEVFVQALNKYLYFNETKNELYCFISEDGISKDNDESISNDKILKVNKINVIRADSDPASNYVICSRICQQMQIADLIIVDVSSQNPNVFYEFGMAVSLDKLILPICFSESFYKLEIPEELREIQLKKGERYDKAVDEKVFHHIGCYPWRKTLYEYYGICFKQNGGDGKEASTSYADFKVVKDENYGFQDIQYARFPYDETIDGSKADDKNDEKRIGFIIYDKLRTIYNKATRTENTLVVYTIEGFLNEDQAGLCIVNFYHRITEKMKKEKCFRGERVGVLVQNQVIPDSDKDARQERHLLYNVGEIIHIGVNQATYLASKEKVLAEDVLPEFNEKEVETKNEIKLTEKRYKEMLSRIKEFIGNRGMIIYPNYPVYVKRITNKTTPDIINAEEGEIKCKIADFFCLFHVMLRNLRFTNEIVVDITNNCLQSLFWLGAAHGSEIDAITVKQVLSEKERIIMEGSAQDNSRNVFDVSGLWTAYYYSYDTEGFYHQLALAQFGIERHSKIIPSDAKCYGFRRLGNLRLHEPDDEKNFRKENTEKESEKKDSNIKSRLALESYYRRRFWNAMLRYNRLRIYLPQHDDLDVEDHDPRMRAAKWDMDAVSGLTHYLSKRAVIGEYLALTMPKSTEDPMAEKVNFICIGQPVKPLKKELIDTLLEKFQGLQDQENHINIVHHYYNKTKIYNEELMIDVQEKGFSLNQESYTDMRLVRYHPWSGCEQCDYNKAANDRGLLDEFPVSREQIACPFIGYSAHTEIAQLILWREDGEAKENRHFRVSLIGSSGPATFALSSLFVDEGQKLHDFLNENDKNEDQGREMQDNCLLYELQLKVRNKIEDIVRERLKEIIEKIFSPTGDLSAKQRNYVGLVLFTVDSYLSTVLYRYFLPFLTDKDIHRIESGITMFVNTMKASRQSPFCPDYRSGIGDNQENPEVSKDNVGAIVKLIPKQIIKAIEEFRGLEVFYKVKVRHCSTENNVEDSEKQEVQNNDVLQSDYKSASSDCGDDDVRTETACHEDTVEGGNGGNPKMMKTICKRNAFPQDNQKDNRTVTEIEMINEINYFMLSSPQQQ